jgi:hypothetical protein
MLPEFEDLRLSNDGAHLTAKATIGLLNFLIPGLLAPARDTFTAEKELYKVYT